MGIGAPAEPTWSYRAIQQHGLFDFTEAEPACEEALAEFREAAASARERQMTFDFILLSAGELALASGFADPERAATIRVPVEEPVTVSPETAFLAAAMADCGWTDLHGLKPTIAAVRPWDVMLFAGDMSKLERLALEETLDLGRIEDLVTNLEMKYSESVSARGRTVAEKGLVRIQGALWKAKLALQVDPDHVSEHISSYVDHFGLTR